MALPNNVPSSIAVGGLYLSPDDLLTTPLVDYEQGGLALNDPSAGLQVQTWRCWWDKDDGWVYVQSDSGSPIQVIEDATITEISFAFDQNMRMALAYVAAGVLKLYWYDSTLPGYTTTTFADCRSPRVGLDDKRQNQLANSDVIFAYIKGDELCYRQQRDRYLTERVLRDGVQASLRLKNIGMSKNLRMQFELA